MLRDGGEHTSAPNWNPVAASVDATDARRVTEFPMLTKAGFAPLPPVDVIVFAAVVWGDHMHELQVGNPRGRVRRN